MYSFKYVLRRSFRNEDKDVWYSEADAQALYRLIRKYHEENPDITNEEIYTNIMELFIKTNAEIVKIPTIKSDTFRYNICKELNSDTHKRREAYDKVHKEESTGRKVNANDAVTYSANKLSSARTLIIQCLLGLRSQQDFFEPEMQKNYRNFFRTSKKVQNEYKRTLNANERRQFDTLKELFEGDEFSQLSIFMKNSEKQLEDELKEDYIVSILFLGERLKEFGLLEKYYDIQGKQNRALGVDCLSYPLKNNGEDTLSIEGIFDRKNLEHLGINKLSMLSAFWMNRFTKELDALNKSLCIVNQLNLWDKVKEAKVKPDGMISVPVDKEALKNVYRKIHFLQECSLVMLDIFDEDDDKNTEEVIDGMTSKKIIKRVDPTFVIKSMESTMGEDYEKYFSSLDPKGTHIFVQEFDNYRVIENAIHNSYRFKDFNMLAILANLHERDFSKNWGVIIENGKNLANQEKVLLGIDVEGFNMPVRLHIDKELVLDFLKANQGSTVIPIYEGSKDFDWMGKKISAPVLMPICPKQKEGSKKLLEQKNGSVVTRNFIEHIGFLVDSREYPEHLKEDVKVKRKGKTKMQRKRPARRFVDLASPGTYYIEKTDGTLEEIVDTLEDKSR